MQSASRDLSSRYLIIADLNLVADGRYLMSQGNEFQRRVPWDQNKFLTATLGAIAAREVTPLYAANFGADCRAFPSALRDVPLHIATEGNASLNESFGINVPTYYLSGFLYVLLLLHSIYLSKISVFSLINFFFLY